MLVLSRKFGEKVRITNKENGQEIIIIVRKSTRKDGIELIFDDRYLNFKVDRIKEERSNDTDEA